MLVAQVLDRRGYDRVDLGRGVRSAPIRSADYPVVKSRIGWLDIPKGLLQLEWIALEEVGQ